MDCIVCDTDAGAHRVIVNTDSTHVEGGFCRTCEEGIFGECFTHYAADHASYCSVCGMDGRYVFLEWSAELATLDVIPQNPDKLLENNESPVLCRTHYCVLTSESARWGTGDASTTEHD